MEKEDRQNYASIKNKIISNIQSATPPNTVVNIVNNAIILCRYTFPLGDARGKDRVGRGLGVWAGYASRVGRFAASTHH